MPRDTHDRIREFWDEDSHTYDSDALARDLRSAGGRGVAPGAEGGAAGTGRRGPRRRRGDRRPVAPRRRARIRGDRARSVAGDARQGRDQGEGARARRADALRRRFGDGAAGRAVRRGDGAPRAVDDAGPGGRARPVEAGGRPARAVRGHLGSGGPRAAREGHSRRRPAEGCSGRRTTTTPPYPQEVLAELPLARLPSPTPLLDAVVEAGWSAVRIKRLRDVEWAARLHEPRPLGWLEHRARYAIVASA